MAAGWITAATLGICSIAAAGDDATAGNDEVGIAEGLIPTERSRALMRDRVAALEAEVAQLRRERRSGGLDQQRTAEIRNLIEDVLDDADTRASLLADGVAAGHDGAFFIADPDGAFRLEFAGQIQVNLVYNHQEGNDVDGDRWGLEQRRMKLKLRGHVGSPAMRYVIGGSFDRGGGSFDISDVYIERDLTDELELRIGNYKIPFSREVIMSSKRQLFADRSLVVKALGLFERTPGAALTFARGRLRLIGAAHDVTGDPFGDEDWLVLARGEVLLDGSWRPLRDFTSFGDDAPATMIGAAVLYQHRDTIGGASDDGDVLRWTADATLELGGASLFAAVFGNHLDAEAGVDRDRLGVLVQGGWFIANDAELTARYSWGDADGEPDDLSVLTLGLNRYFHRHRAKLTLNVGYGFNAVEDFWSSSSAGWRADAAGDNGQVVVVTQVQVLF